MIEVSLETLMGQQKKISKAVKESKSAQKSMRKAHKKLRKALHSQNVQEIKILLGMAQVAISKAEFLAGVKR